MYTIEHEEMRFLRRDIINSLLGRGYKYIRIRVRDKELFLYGQELNAYKGWQS